MSETKSGKSKGSGGTGSSNSRSGRSGGTGNRGSKDRQARRKRQLTTCIVVGIWLGLMVSLLLIKGQSDDNSWQAALGGAGESGWVQPADSAGGAGGNGSAQDPEDNVPGAVQPLEVHYMDVGQGDSILLRCGGQNMLIDTSTSDKGTAIQNYLQKQGVEKLDYLVLTHPDSDHIGSAAVIITKFDIDTVFVSNYEKDNKTYQKMIQALDDKGLKGQVPEVGSTFTLGSAVCTVLGPCRTYDDPNDASVALLIQNGDNRFLFTGDAEEDAEADILSTGIDIHADVYKAGHHGSRTSSSEAFLDAVDPSCAVISCGIDNSYGHPHAQTLNRLRERGIQVYRTDEQGTVIAISDGTTITWNTAPSDTWKAGE